MLRSILAAITLPLLFSATALAGGDPAGGEVQLTSLPQEAVFFIGVGTTGGPGGAPVLDAPSRVFMAPSFEEEHVQPRLPACTVGPVSVRVSARIQLVKTARANHSIEGSPMVSFVMAEILELHEVSVADATPCPAE